jgi:flagellar hook-associated protein 3 FlgL
MDRVTSEMTTRGVLNDIQAVYAQLSKTQNVLSSGKQITQPSDDPFGTSRALLFKGELAANQQYQTNVGEAGSWLSTTDTALSSISDDVGRARDLILQGANGTMSQTDRDAIADELEQLADSVKTAANTQYAGSYVFAGTKTQTQPFTLGAIDTFNGDTNAIAREIGQGVTVPVNVDGSAVISPAIAAIRQAITDLRAGGTPANLSGSDLQAIDAATDTISSTRAIVGARQNRLSLATDRLQQLQQAQTQSLSNTEDADMAQTMINFSQQSAVYQAALRAGASLIQPSLLDFLTNP